MCEHQFFGFTIGWNRQYAYMIIFLKLDENVEFNSTTSLVNIWTVLLN